MISYDRIRSLALCTMLLVLVASGASAQQAAVSGRVTDAQTGQPIVGAQVSIVGSNIGGQTNTDGRYTLRGFAAGTFTVRVLSIGYGELTRQVSVAPGEAATLDFEMRPMAIALNPLTVTATGEQRRIEVGNSIAYVNASEVMQTRAVSNMADLMTARAAGVLVIPGTQTGAGVRFRIRGNSSISLTNNPIFVIDGIRVEGTTGSLSVGVGGTTPTRINDINPDEIESIEVVRGPSASTLYGTDAANGVIVIRTKRGIAGRPQWTYYTEQTAITDRNDYPTAYFGWRTGPTAGTTSARTNFVQCFLFQVGTGVCAQDSVTSYNLHNDKEATPYGVGYRQGHGLQVRGGTESLRYFLHGEWEDETGRLKLPEFDKRWLAERGLELRPEQRNPNAMNRISARSNVDIDLSSSAAVSISAGYTNQVIRLPRSDDSGVPGLATNTYGGMGYKWMLHPTTGDTLYGYRTVTPRETYGTVTEQGINRMIGSVSTNWRPMEWLSARALFGLDYINRKDTQLCRFLECPVSGQDHLGWKRDNRTTFGAYTFDAAATANRTFSPTLEGKTTIGVQFNRSTFDRNGATGRQLPPGASTVSAGAIKESDEVNSETRTLGGYVEQHLAFQDRLFLTGAIRSDRNSAFGADFKTVFYPKLSASWVLSEESFFPQTPFVSQLRLRTAYGASGVQPSTTAAVEFFTDATYLGESGEESGLIYSALGNRQLKPERSTEIEFGIDGTFWDGRLIAELTYYDKNSRDALISRVLPPSIGTGATARFENLGHVRNWGWEGLLNAQLVETRNLGWDVTINAATNNNRLIDLGDVPPLITTTQQNREGYPLFGWWSRTITWEDKDGNGIITYNANPELSDITVASEATFQGHSLPRHEIAATTGFDLWGRRLRLATMVDYKGGHLIYNNTERIRCASRNNCRGLIDPEAPLWEQARTVAVRQFGTSVLGGFLEKGDFLRWRELALTFNMPQEWANRVFRGRSLVATAAARNLGILWTEYTGVDPEAFGTTGNAPSEFQAFAPPTYFTLRLTFGF
jgi:TonB-linked SusC/RagA family outer membrane protein